MEYIDLHVHSNKSDGTLTPREVVFLAKKKGLKAIALTDHDTVEGVWEAVKAGEETGVIVIPGIEISADFNGTDLHILGLNIDYTNSSFNDIVDMCQKNRNDRNNKIIEKMQNDGIDISREKMLERFGEVSVTRAHFARYLVEKEYVNHKNTAFDMYLNKGKKYYIPREKITSKMAIDIIKGAKGHPVLAHPLLYKFGKDRLKSLFDYLKSLGLEGIEGIYSLNTPSDDVWLKRMAENYGFYITGGSDFHGDNKPDIDLGVGKGNLKIPETILYNIMCKE
ncbi:MAG: PHP domain-containing protein [Lachnospiraceae bacterium]|nr:PHP domain-containing protein [Lachnospiraceae bacterium]